VNVSANPKINPVDQPPSAVEPISEIIGRVGHELDVLAEQLNHVQGLIGTLAKKASALDPGLLQELQAVDHIEQKMVCLSRFLTSLEPLMQGHWVLDLSEASEVVTLSELARRLRKAEHLIEEDPHVSGDFEMF
jgi:hypothetical protein